MVKKNASRLEVVKKIEEYEREGRFYEDVENDPPSRPIKPGEVDYLRKKLSSKIKAHYAYKMGRKFLNEIISTKKMIIKDIVGAENLKGLKTGAVMTCNHFNAFDSFAIQVAYEACVENTKKKKFFRVIREGNYTSFPGFYGFLMRNCYTLPLGSSPKVLAELMTSTEKLLNDGHIVLVYPEQSMWWNYRKPKPLKRGAYRFAVKANVPVVPCFITMKDSSIIDEDGFNVQEYTIHIEKPIYPKGDLSNAENMEYLLNENYRVWTKIYEDAYQTELTYTTKFEVKPEL